MYEWKRGNAYSTVVTISANYLTLNSAAASHFADVRYCMLGWDKNNRKLAIKPVTRSEIDLKLVAKEQLYRISVGNAYCRIGCKLLIDELKNNYGIAVDNVKYASYFNEVDNLLEVDLNI